MIDFTLVSAIENVEVIAVSRRIRDLARLNRVYGLGRWRKLKGTAIDMTEENPSPRFVVCVNNSESEASLEFGKIYRVIPDASAEHEGLLRIIDESGEDYGFAASRFYPVQLPAQLEQMLSVSADS